MKREMILGLIGEASLAPSVHNVQPARWRIEGEGLILFEDTTTRLLIADPDGNDAAMSLGATVEGLVLAASRRGLSIRSDTRPLPEPTPSLRPVARYRFEKNGTPDRLRDVVSRRKSWRGAFLKPNDADRLRALLLQADDCAIITDAEEISVLAKLVDQASFGFMKEESFRTELLSWMRLSRKHKRWSKDGLSAPAMKLNALEAWAAGIAMGPAFNFLDRILLASKLLAETQKTKSAAGLLVFHRPQAEGKFESGRHFYRLWLRIEAAGFGAAVLAALADDPNASEILARKVELPHGRKVISAFRIGRRPANAKMPRARRPLDELLV